MKALLKISTLALAMSASTVVADDVHEVAGEAEAAADHSGQHGHLSFREVVSGEHAWEFWGSVINFLMLVALLRMMSKRPLQNFLNNRRESIDKGIREASAVKAKAEAVFNEYTERMKTLDQELTKLRSDIASSATQDRAKIVAEAEESAKRVKAETELLVTRQAEQLEADIRREVVQAAIDAAERAVREVATAEDQRRLADAFARELALASAGPAKEKRA